MSYLPLDFVKNEDKSNYFEKQKAFLLENRLVTRDFSKKEYMDYIFSKEFFAINSNTIFSGYNKYMMENTMSLMQLINCNLNDIKMGYISPKTEWMDMTAAPMVINEWCLNKQVYKLDKDFAMALKDTEKFSLYRYNIERVPCNPFYIDMSEVTSMYPIHGVFVYTKIHKNIAYIYIIMLRYDKIFFSWANEIEFTMTDELVIDKAKIPQTKSFRAFLDDEDCKVDNKPFDENGNDIPKADILMLCMQMLIYLSSREPDIHENSISKQTYKKPNPNKIKNKYSEVQTYDVGVSYGKAIRISKKSIIEPQHRKHVGNNIETAADRKSPRPHFRNAHWSHYWTGKGRKNLEVRWIEPVFVGLNKNMENLSSNVVIHKVI